MVSARGAIFLNAEVSIMSTNNSCPTSRPRNAKQKESLNYGRVGRKKSYN